MSKTRESVVDVAARWYARVHAPDCTGRDREEFEAWLRGSPDHWRAYADAERIGIVPESDVVQVMDGPTYDPIGNPWYLITDGDVTGFQPGSQERQFGTFSIDADGTWTYTLNNAAPAVQALGAAQETVTDTVTRDTGFGVHVADLPARLGADRRIRFTLLWLDEGRWEGADYEVSPTPADEPCCSTRSRD